jgi:type I restriction enzyme S subunit
VDHVDDYLFDGDFLLVAEDGENLRTRTTPVAFMASDRFWVNNHAHVLTGKDGNDTRFLMYAIQQSDISGFITGSTQPKLSQGNLNRMPLVLPPTDVQRAIAGLLGALDDKIDVNRRMGETLEEIARTLFQSWFVDFDPVREAASVPEDIRRLFPDRLVDSSIGPAPDGWEVAPLGDHIEVTRGLSYTGAGLADEGMPLHNLNSIREGGGYKENGIKYYVDEYRDRDVVHPGDVIVANTDLTQNARVIGSPAIVPSAWGASGLYSQDLNRVRPRAGTSLTSRWLYLLLSSARMRLQVASYANGTTVLHLAKEGLTKPSIVVPPHELVQRFDAFVDPMLQQQELLTAESKTLAELRDVLLPKLLSGEFRIEVDVSPGRVDAAEFSKTPIPQSL